MVSDSSLSSPTVICNNWQFRVAESGVALVTMQAKIHKWKMFLGCNKNNGVDCDWNVCEHCLVQRISVQFQTFSLHMICLLWLGLLNFLSGLTYTASCIWHAHLCKGLMDKISTVYQKRGAQNVQSCFSSPFNHWALLSLLCCNVFECIQRHWALL